MYMDKPLTIVKSGHSMASFHIKLKLLYLMKILLEKTSHGEQIVEKLYHGGRQFKDELSLFDF